ncbi:Cation channel sperm-associated protein 1, partial [Galemys pyrenaicus]
KSQIAMDQHSTTDKAQDAADTSNLDMTTLMMSTTMVAGDITVGITAMLRPTTILDPPTMLRLTTKVDPPTVLRPTTTLDPAAMVDTPTMLRPTTMVDTTITADPTTTVGPTTMLKPTTMVDIATTVGPTTTLRPTTTVDTTTTADHHGGHRHHGGPDHHTEADHHGGHRHHGGPDHHAEADHHGGHRHHGGPDHHAEADHHGGHRHHGGHHHHHGEIDHHGGLHHPGETHDHSGPHHHAETHHHGGHHRQDESNYREFFPSDHDYYREAYHEVFSSYKPHSMTRTSHGSTHSRKGITAHVKSSAFNLDHSLSATHPRVSKISSKVHPQKSTSKSLEDWSEDDEQFQKRKTILIQRSHKKHTMGLCYWLWEKLSDLFQELRAVLRKLTESLAFEVFIIFIIFLNTIMLVAQTFAEVEVRGEWYFLALDSVFLCVYLIEAVLKIIVQGFKYFFDSWNKLDFLIVVMAVVDFLLLQFNAFSTRSVYNQSIFRILKVFKSLRALRAFRVLRRLRFLTSLQEVTGTLARSLPSITAILILMFTCLFLFSVVLRALFHQHDRKRFQDIFTTIFTLFTLLTLDDWSLIYLDSRAQGAWYIIPILMIYIIIQYFIFLNLVIAVLVDNFQMALLKGLEKVKQEVPRAELVACPGNGRGGLQQERDTGGQGGRRGSRRTEATPFQKAAQIHERLLEDSLTELSRGRPRARTQPQALKSEEPVEVLSEITRQKQLLEKKLGTLTEKQQELLFQFLQLAAAVEHHQQKFRSQAAVIDEIVDTAFEAGEEDFRK